MAARKKARDGPSPYAMPVLGDTLSKTATSSWQASPEQVRALDCRSGVCPLFNPSRGRPSAVPCWTKCPRGCRHRGVYYGLQCLCLGSSKCHPWVDVSGVYIVKCGVWVHPLLDVVVESEPAGASLPRPAAHLCAPHTSCYSPH